MTARNDTIAAMVRSELTKNPQIDNAALLEQAKQIDPRVRKLSARQFHATYRLPVVRALGRAGASREAATGTPARPAVPAAPADAPRPRRGRPPRVAAPPTETVAQATPVATTSAPVRTPARTPATTAARPSTDVSRPNAAEREAVRQILHSIAREALGTEDRASFVRLLDSLDERANGIVGLFRRS
jgi:hypothetical protein